MKSFTNFVVIATLSTLGAFGCGGVSVSPEDVKVVQPDVTSAEEEEAEREIYDEDSDSGDDDSGL